MYNPWLALSFKSFELALEAQSVIALRMMRLATGGARGKSETRRMVTEKFAAAAEAQTAALTGIMTGRKHHVVAGKALAKIKKRVHANKKRLSRGR